MNFANIEKGSMHEKELKMAVFVLLLAGSICVVFSDLVVAKAVLESPLWLPSRTSLGASSGSFLGLTLAVYAIIQYLAVAKSKENDESIIPDDGKI